MKFLLDTCAISEMLKSKPDKKFINWIDDQDENDLFLSILTLGELYKGAFKLQDKHRRDVLFKWIEHELKIRFHGRILELDEQAIFNWGKMNGDNARRGRNLPVIDSMISAIALTHDLTVVSRNETDFALCSVNIINPWS